MREELAKTSFNPYILLVEDDLIVQQIHRRKLEDFGCTVDSAVNGKEALDKCKNQYNLIVMDWGLPDLDGITVCKQIRKYESNNHLSHVPIVMITAYLQTSEMHQTCSNAGINQVFEKPIIDDDTWTNLLKEAIK